MNRALLAAYRAARPQFILREVVINGTRCKELSDPVLGIAMVSQSETLLRTSFRARWIAIYRTQHSASRHTR